MSILQSSLPYEENALEPHVSQQTLKYHYGKHHSGYVDKLNALIKNTDYDDLSLEQIIVKAREDADLDILNNAAQVWNHGFLWHSMSPDGDREPEGRIKEMIESQFGSVSEFKQRFRDAAVGLFGSGWVWLVLDKDIIRIMTTGNADSPVGTVLVPLLTLDVWEHAYYLDYRNERKRYVDTFLENLINWDFAESNLRQSRIARAA